jgi:hypothetical protein
MMSLEQITTEIRQMSISQRKQLIAIIVDTLTEEISTRSRSILEFEGIGERLSDGIDPQDYVDQLRSDWDTHS